MTSANSFSSVVKIHAQLNEIFFRHQDALLHFDLAEATQQLANYRQALGEHIQIEEQILMPVYQRAGRIVGGPVEFFTGEHQKLFDFLTQFDQLLSALCQQASPSSRDLIKLFDEEARYKQLLEHHEMREENIFFPTLDRVTEASERQALLAHFFPQQDLSEGQQG